MSGSPPSLARCSGSCVHSAHAGQSSESMHAQREIKRHALLCVHAHHFVFVDDVHLVARQMSGEPLDRIDVAIRNRSMQRRLAVVVQVRAVGAGGDCAQ